MDIEDVIIAWALQSAICADNPENPDITLCNVRMFLLEVLQDALWTFKGKIVPNALQAWFDAEDDNACSSCWVSSNTSSNHPECNEKIDRWFVVRSGLKEYAKTLNTKKLGFPKVSDYITIGEKNGRRKRSKD